MTMTGEDHPDKDRERLVRTLAGSDDPAAALCDLVLDVAATTGDSVLPLRAAARLLSSREVPASDLAFLLWSLHETGMLTSEILGELGMTPEGVEALASVAASAGSGTSSELEVRTTLEKLEKELDSMVSAEAATFAPEHRSILGLVLAEFALSEGLHTLGEALERIREEAPERLPTPENPAS